MTYNGIIKFRFDASLIRRASESSLSSDWFNDSRPTHNVQILRGPSDGWNRGRRRELRCAAGIDDASLSIGADSLVLSGGQSYLAVRGRNEVIAEVRKRVLVSAGMRGRGSVGRCRLRSITSSREPNHTYPTLGSLRLRIVFAASAGTPSGRPTYPGSSTPKISRTNELSSRAHRM
jgi:hypothetical protein